MANADDRVMVDYRAVFQASFERINEESRRQRFFARFYEHFIASDSDVAGKFQDTDFDRQKEMLRESLAEMMDFCLSLKSNPYIVTLARIHGARGRDIPVGMFDLWLDSLVATIAELDPENSESVELAWRIVMAPGIEFMKLYRDR